MTRSWTAQMAAADASFTGAPLLRKQFRLDTDHGEVIRATLHASALGVFEAYLAGQPVSDDVWSPGWSAYEWRLRFLSYDLSGLRVPQGMAFCAGTRR